MRVSLEKVDSIELMRKHKGKGEKMATLDVQIENRIQDFIGTPASQALYAQVPDTTTLAALATAAQTVQTDLDKITDGQITFSQVKVVIPLVSGLKAAPTDPGSTVEDTGLFTFLVTAAPNRSYSTAVPAIAQSKVVNGKINLSDADIQNWVNLISVAGAVFTFVSQVFQAIGRLLHSLISARKHRKPELRRSFEV